MVEFFDNFHDLFIIDLDSLNFKKIICDKYMQ